MDTIKVSNEHYGDLKIFEKENKKLNKRVEK